jgi:hypothetical protein
MTANAEDASEIDAYPRGEIASVLLTRVQIRGEGPVTLGFRLATENTNRHPELREVAGRPCVVDRETGSIWLMIEPSAGLEVRARPPINDPKDPRIELDIMGEVSCDKPRTVLLKLASPVVEEDQVARLAGVTFDRAGADTVAYWEDWLAQGRAVRGSGDSGQPSIPRQSLACAHAAATSHRRARSGPDRSAVFEFCVWPVQRGLGRSTKPSMSAI